MKKNGTTTQACQSGQNVAGSTQIAIIKGCQRTVRWLTLAYNQRGTLMSYQRSSFDKFVAASGKFGQTEAQILKWLCEDSVAGNRHELLEKLTQHFMKKEGRIPKRVHAIWSQIDSLVATYGDRKTTIGIRWGEYGKLSPRALLDEERPKVDINLVAGSGGFKLEPLIDYY